MLGIYVNKRNQVHSWTKKKVPVLREFTFWELLSQFYKGRNWDIRNLRQWLRVIHLSSRAYLTDPLNLMPRCLPGSQELKDGVFRVKNWRWWGSSTGFQVEKWQKQYGVIPFRPSSLILLINRSQALQSPHTPPRHSLGRVMPGFNELNSTHPQDPSLMQPLETQ